jgi:hypothetical protein
LPDADVLSLKSIKSEKISIDQDASSIKSMKSDVSKFVPAEIKMQLLYAPYIAEENDSEEQDFSEQSSNFDNNQVDVYSSEE